MVYKIPENKKIVLFDGVCNFCNDSVLKIIKYDKNNVFLFASLQSKFGKELLTRYNVNTTIDSIVLIIPDKNAYFKSTAGLLILSHFPWVWKTLGVFWILPKRIRDKLYDLFAQNRYKWFGKKEQCMIPSPEIRAKFIED